MKLIATTMLAMALLSPQANAEFKTTQSLYADLKLTNDPKLVGSPKSMMAAGYVMGVYESVSGQAVCAGEVTLGQLTKAVLNFIETHPQRWNNPAINEVGVALAVAWPCTEKK